MRYLTINIMKYVQILRETRRKPKSANGRSIYPSLVEYFFKSWMEETIIVIIGTSLCHEYNPNVVFLRPEEKEDQVAQMGTGWSG